MLISHDKDYLNEAIWIKKIEHKCAKKKFLCRFKQNYLIEKSFLSEDSALYSFFSNVLRMPLVKRIKLIY